MPRNDDRKFWSLVTPEPNTGYWLWMGTITSWGYGHFSLGGKVWRAHRLAWKLIHGEEPPQLNHRCDQRACVNPGHLYIGTQLQNMRDRLQREGYRTVPRGEGHSCARLTSEQVTAIRMSADSCSAVARAFGISQPHVSRIRSGKRRNGDGPRI